MQNKRLKGYLFFVTPSDFSLIVTLLRRWTTYVHMIYETLRLWFSLRVMSFPPHHLQSFVFKEPLLYYELYCFTNGPIVLGMDSISVSKTEEEGKAWGHLFSWYNSGEKLSGAHDYKG